MKIINPLQTIVDSCIYLYNTLTTTHTEKAKVHAVIQATHLRNLDGIYPTLTNSKPIPTGTQYTYALPPGIALKEWIDRKQYLELYTQGQVEIFPPAGPSLTLQIHHQTFPDEITFQHDPPVEYIAPIPIGNTPDGNTMYIDLSELPHMLVGGLPGFGKTSTLKGWTVSLKLSGCEVFVIDRKRIDFPSLIPWINVAQTEEEALALVKTLLEENTKRQDILLAHNVTKIQDLPPNTLPYMVLIVDEAAAIETKDTYEGIDTLARLARATGISLIIATQKPSAKLWDGTFSNTRDMLAGRISFFVADYMMSQIILGKGTTSAARLPMKKGRAVTVLGDRERIVQTMFLPPTQAESMLRELDHAPYYQTIEPVQPKPKPKRGRPKKNGN